MFTRTFVEARLGLERATYAWTIDAYPRDADGCQVEDDDHREQGPSNAPEELLAQLDADPDAGEKFRILDDDGNVYMLGRILIPGEADSGDGSGDVHEAPLWDIGEAYGATDIQYREKTDAGGTTWRTF